jgi:hypothetical protein
MIERTNLIDEPIIYSSFKLFFVFLLKLEMVASTRNQNTSSNHSCFTCMEPLFGYSKFYNSHISKI